MGLHSVTLSVWRDPLAGAKSTETTSVQSSLKAVPILDFVIKVANRHLSKGDRHDSS